MGIRSRMLRISHSRQLVSSWNKMTLYVVSVSQTALTYILDWTPPQITRVIYVVFSKRDEDVYREIIPQYFPPDPEHGHGSV